MRGVIDTLADPERERAFGFVGESIERRVWWEKESSLVRGLRCQNFSMLDRFSVHW